jgi:acetyl esterase
VNDPLDQRQIIVEDVVYHIADGKPLLARLYRPLGHGLSAGMVSVHGGRWCSETRLTNAVLDYAIAQSGVVVMAIDFRMPPDVQYPAPVSDINFAIRWLKSRAHAYEINVDMVGGIGTSSGGHQILLNALKPTDQRYAAAVFSHADVPTLHVPNASLAYVVACWPVTDPFARYHYAIARTMVQHIESHQAYWVDEAAMAEGSPQRIVAEGEATHLPPLLLVQGTDDTVVTPDMTDRFARAYAAAGGDVELKKFANERHTFITKTPKSMASKTAIATIRDFVGERCSFRKPS